MSGNFLRLSKTAAEPCNHQPPRHHRVGVVFLPFPKQGLTTTYSKPEGAPSHVLRSPDNPSGTACHLPLHRGGWKILLCAPSPYTGEAGRFCSVPPPLTQVRLGDFAPCQHPLHRGGFHILQNHSHSRYNSKVFLYKGRAKPVPPCKRGQAPASLFEKYKITFRLCLFTSHPFVL